MTPSKQCEQCGKTFEKPPKNTPAQWEPRRFCSSHCSGTFNLPRSRGGWNKTRHRMSRTPTYQCWIGMRQRCENPDSQRYDRYGARGITVCERWSVFENFLQDMGEKPPGLTIERKNNDAGYCLDNCVWATRKQQAANTSLAYRIPIDGKVLPLSEAAKALGMSQSSLSQRIKKVGVLDAISSPYVPYKRAASPAKAPVCRAKRSKPERKKRDGYRGVYWDKCHQKWRAEIGAGPKRPDGKRKHLFLGYHAELADAAKAYDRAAIQHFGSGAALNFQSNDLDAAQENTK